MINYTPDDIKHFNYLKSNNPLFFMILKLFLSGIGLFMAALIKFFSTIVTTAMLYSVINRILYRVMFVQTDTVLTLNRVTKFQNMFCIFATQLKFGFVSILSFVNATII